MKKLIIGFVFLFSIGSILYSQKRPFVDITSEVRPQNINVGERGVFVIVCDIESGYHISDVASGMFKVVIDSLKGVSFGQIEFPSGENESFGIVYRNKIEVKVPFIVTKDATIGNQVITAQVIVQPCGDINLVCYPPETLRVGAVFSILSNQKEIQAVPDEPRGITERLNRSLEQGSLIAFFLVFLGGILTSLTPCVYPMIPVTIAVIGAQATGGKLKGFILSLFYVLGIAITFSILGIIAARTGALFGSYTQHPVVIILISSIFFIMGLSMLGVFILQMPSSLASKLRSKQRHGYLGAVLTGLLAGLIVSPCISPLLVVILAWVARSGSIILGFGLLFSFAIGLGLLFILIGTFSGVLKNLPKSGGWMEFIERGFGVLLIILAILFIRSVVSSLVYQGLWAIFLMVLGTYAGAFTPLDREADWIRKIGKVIGILSVIVSGCLIFLGFMQYFEVKDVQTISVSYKHSSAEETMWLTSDNEGFTQARLAGKPVLIDFYAEWCAACRELDEKTWSDKTIRNELERFVTVKLDLTRLDTRTNMIQKRYNIVGMPTVILFDSSGKEINRFVGFKNPVEVLSILHQY